MTPMRPAAPITQTPSLHTAPPEALAKALLRPLMPPDPSLQKRVRSDS